MIARLRENRYRQFLKKVLHQLRGQRLNCLTLGFFIIFSLIIFGLVFETYKTTSCGDKLNLKLPLIIWTGMFVCGYAVLVCFFDIIDPLKILFKLQCVTFASFLLVLATMFLQIPTFGLEKKMGTSHFALVVQKLWWIFQMTLWYHELLVPFIETCERGSCEASHKRRIGLPSFLDTLTTPSLLLKFANHLVCEWSIENLDFYKTTLLHRTECTKSVDKILKTYKKIKLQSAQPWENKLLTRISIFGSGTKQTGFQMLHTALADADKLLKRIRLKAIRIHLRYTAAYAPAQVNLSARVTRKIHQFFSREEFLAMASEPEFLSTALVNGLSQTETHQLVMLSMSAANSFANQNVNMHNAGDITPEISLNINMTRRNSTQSHGNVILRSPFYLKSNRIETADSSKTSGPSKRSMTQISTTTKSTSNNIRSSADLHSQTKTSAEMAEMDETTDHPLPQKSSPRSRHQNMNKNKLSTNEQKMGHLRKENGNDQKYTMGFKQPQKKSNLGLSSERSNPSDIGSPKSTQRLVYKVSVENKKKTSPRKRSTNANNDEGQAMSFKDNFTGFCEAVRAAAFSPQDRDKVRGDFKAARCELSDILDDFEIAGEGDGQDVPCHKSSIQSRQSSSLSPNYRPFRSPAILTNNSSPRAPKLDSKERPRGDSSKPQMRNTRSSRAKSAFSAFENGNSPKISGRKLDFLYIIKMRRNILKVCSQINECSSVFNIARHSVYDTMEADSFPRFLQKLERERSQNAVCL
mmetsp:Transcript_18146/g.44522  ORF Transcript_18146/g.44522 Transcript_18146/m.44522 type:complete len:751 (+) Transcript_18146:561-2813(+)